MEFRRRYYRRPGELFADLRALLAARREVTPVMRGHSLDAAFRERLMLAVTAVNGCRYCAYGHARMALAAGVPAEQVQALAEGIVEGCPPQEAPALLYAQHWAESDGQPTPEARARLEQLYGASTAGAIDTALRVIRMGNLMGNTLDYWLWRLSGGRWGTPVARHSSIRAQHPTLGGRP